METSPAMGLRTEILTFAVRPEQCAGKHRFLARIQSVRLSKVLAHNHCMSQTTRGPPISLLQSHYPGAWSEPVDTLSP